MEEYEIKEERTENSTTYQLPSGEKKTVFYSEDVRYRNESGQLIDYDESFVKLADEQEFDEISRKYYAYENKQGDAKNFIPKSLSEKTPILLCNGDYKVSMAPAVGDEYRDNEFNNQKTLDSVQEITEKTTDIYDDVKEKITTVTYSNKNNTYLLKYVSATNGIKEELVLNELPETNVWKFLLKLEGVTPKLQNNTILLFETGTDDVVGMIEAPNMNDATGNAYSEAIAYEIQKVKGDSYLLTMKVDEEYLYHRDRVYPVTIDPTVSWTGSSNVTDVYVINGATYGNVNFYNNNVTTMAVGRGKQGLCRTYISFSDLSKVLNDCSISSAKLTLYETGSNKGETIQAYRVTENWNKTNVTWNTRPGYGSTIHSSFVSTGITGQSSNLDLTTYVRNVVKGTFEDYGIMLRAKDETVDSGIFAKFYGSRNATSSKRPKLTVVYYDKPTAASTVSVASKYVKKGSAVKVSWDGIQSVALKNIQYKVMNYDEDSKASTTTFRPYQNLATAPSGTKTISESKNWPEGSYKIFIRGVDNYGSVGIGTGVVVRIDGTAPQFTKCSISPNTSSDTYAASRPTLTWGGASDKNLSRVEYCVNDSAYRTLPSLSGSAKLLPSFFNGTGKYVIKVRAVDKAGNYSKTYQFDYYYDVIKPEIKYVKILPKEISNTQTPYIAWSISDDTLKSISYSVNGEMYNTNLSKESGCVAIKEGVITEEGTYRIAVQATDKAGNVTISDEIEYVYDITAPTFEEVNIEPQTDAENYSACKEPVISWSGLGDKELSSIHYQVYLDDALCGEEEKTDAIENSGGIILNSKYFNESGNYKIVFWGVDAAGNKGEVFEFSYYYDGKGPVITKSKLVKETANGKPTVYLEDVSDDVSNIMDEVYYTIVPSEAADVTEVNTLISTGMLKSNDDKTFSFSLSEEDIALPEGIYTIFFVLKDSLGNTSDIQKVAYYKLDRAVYDGTIELEGQFDLEREAVNLSWKESESIKSVDVYARQGQGI